jgi:hypothetical protein
MIQMTKEEFKNPEEYFEAKDAMKYYVLIYIIKECIFYSHLTKIVKINQNLLTPGENEKY